MALFDIFIEAVQGSLTLPPEVHAHAHEALVIEQTQFDETYIEFLDTQIRLSPRGPEWTARLRQRREDLQAYCGITLVRGVVPVGDRHFSLHVMPERKTVINWEEYDYPYPTAA